MRRPRWLWPTLSAPGTLWSALFFAVPFYGVLSVAGGRDNLIFDRRDPLWNPFVWHTDAYTTVWDRIRNGEYGTPFQRTCFFVVRLRDHNSHRNNQERCSGQRDKQMNCPTRCGDSTDEQYR